jgi:hypothetical protein
MQDSAHSVYLSIIITVKSTRAKIKLISQADFIHLI